MMTDCLTLERQINPAHPHHQLSLDALLTRLIKPKIEEEDNQPLVQWLEQVSLDLVPGVRNSRYGLLHTRRRLLTHHLNQVTPVLATEPMADCILLQFSVLSTA